MELRLLTPMLSVLALALAGCGGNGPTCTTTACSNNSAKTYQSCVDPNGSVTYNLGGQNCDCSAAGCTSCATSIASYCGASTGGGGGSCQVTLSGAVSGTFSCDAGLLYTNNISALLIDVANPTPLGLISATLYRSGMPTSGTWTSSDGISAGDILVEQPGSQGSVWHGGVNLGSFTTTITVGSMVSGGSGRAYHVTGSCTATLPPSDTGATGMVSFSATF